MKTLTLTPTMDAMAPATAFFESALEEAGVSMKVIAQVNIAVDEIFSNIARCSGATTAKLDCDLTETQVLLRFTDNGVPYDPTAKPDPDITLSAEERPIGGLGIFMVKKSMDEVRYEHKDGCNVLTLVKKL